MNDEVGEERYSKAEKEAVARAVVAGFMTRVNPTLAEIRNSAISIPFSQSGTSLKSTTN